MSSLDTVHVKIYHEKIKDMERDMIKGLFRMAYDVQNNAKARAPYLTGALRSSIRVQETAGETALEVVAGGSFAGYKIDYAMKREQGPNRDPSTVGYMRKATQDVMSGDYVSKYFRGTI